MTSKTFKSVNADAKKDLLVVVEVEEGVNIHTESPVDRRGVSIAPCDAPALCLAILEAAGGRDAFGIDVSNAMTDLREYVKEQEREAAAEADRVKLEAEALKFYNAHRAYSGIPPESSWDGYNEIIKKSWLAVARRARELNKEAGQ